MTLGERMAEQYLSITELNQRIAALLERNVPLLWVQGEISNLTRAASGHWYFSLKDEKAQVRAVMFRQKINLLNWQPREGDAVQAYVSAGLYTPRGDFQLTVETLRPAGLGTLYERFLKLKAQLEREGLFDPNTKQGLPYFVRKIGVVTSPQAAALRDVAHTLARRAPHIEIFLYPTLVQGESAAPQIARAIALANQNKELDALLIIRGGGSLEDLWAFNEPEVAHAIFKSRLPTISGVGHETDTTIADFVADQRAATPTAAAELISSPSHADWQAELSASLRALQRAMRHAQTQAEQRLDRATFGLLTPAQQLTHKQLHVRQLWTQLQHSFSRQLTQAEQRWQYTARNWQRAQPDIPHHAGALAHRQQLLQQAMQRLLQQREQRSRHAAQSLQQLNPHNVLQRGFAYVQTQTGRIVYNADTLQSGDGITIQLARGRVVGTVNHTETE